VQFQQALDGCLRGVPQGRELLFQVAVDDHAEGDIGFSAEGVSVECGELALNGQADIAFCGVCAGSKVCTFSRRTPSRSV